MKIPFMFTPVKDFEAMVGHSVVNPENGEVVKIPPRKSTYCTGLVYTVRDAKSDLAKQVAGWLKEGLVIEETGPKSGVSRVGGVGKVS